MVDSQQRPLPRRPSSSDTMPTTTNPWKTLQTILRFENPWFRVIQNEVINPGGGPGEYTYVDFKSRAVAVVPIDDDDHTYLVGQYRYATDSYEWEVPEGGAPEGEAPSACARRELLEETGLVANRWDLVVEGVQLSNSITNERGFIFVARDLRQETPQPEEAERIEIRRVPLAEAFEMALDGRIRDGFSIISLLTVQSRLQRKELH